MIERIINSLKRRVLERKVKNSFANDSFLEPIFSNFILSPEYVYRDDNSTYVSSFINHEDIDISPWESDEKSYLSRLICKDSYMKLSSRAKKENWMCFFYKIEKNKYSFSFDVIDHYGLDEIQVSFQCNSLKDRYRFMIRNNKTAVFEVIKNGRFYKYVKQINCEIPLEEKHNIKVVVDGLRYSFLVDGKIVLSILDKKQMIKIGEDNFLIMIFYNRNGEINCDVSNTKMQF